MEWKGKRVDTGEPIQVAVHNGVIRSVEAAEDDGHLPWISPGWIDLQVNGFAGYDFNDETTTAQDFIGVTRAMWTKGVTSYLPTVITGSFERICRAMAAYAELCESADEVNFSIPGIHLEGPYLSDEDGPRGAHDRAHIRNPDWQEFMEWQNASGGRIRLVTVAPEREGAISFIQRLHEAGIIVSLGHTNATAEQINQAIEAGAALSTHLGNGAHPILPRHPNYIWEQLGDDRLWATFIPDGHHLAPKVLKSMVRAKQSKALFVSDCVKFGGLPPGRYTSEIGSEVILHADGRLNTAANPAILAGSAQSLDLGIASALQKAGIDLSEAIQAVTARPAEAMGFDRLGRLEPGAAGNLTLFHFPDPDGELAIVETVVNGNIVYKYRQQNKPNGVKSDAS